MGLADERKPVNLMTVHVSKSVTVHEVSNTYRRKMEENAAYPSKHEKTDKKYCSKSGV